jgi:antitoxin StbD
MVDVVTTGQARDALRQIARRLDPGDDAEPMYFGSDRRPQAVIVPVEIWERLLEAAEDEVDLATARRRTGSGDQQRLTRDDLDAALARAAQAAGRASA